VICKQIETLVTGAGTNILSIKAPALEALLLNPVLHEHAPHGLIMALTTISTIINTNQTMMEHCRHMGRQLVKQEVEDIQNRMTQLVRVIEYVLTLIDAELNRFCPSDVRTKEDKEMVEGLTKILRGDS
jgi:hypothetical protein